MDYLELVAHLDNYLQIEERILPELEKWLDERRQG